MNAWRLMVALALALAGCTSNRIPLTYDHHISGWAVEIRSVAQRSYLYAQMAANAYGPTGPYDLGPDIERIDYADNDDRGFAYAVYQRRDGDRVAETVIAFRGTEFTKASDWFYGNLLSLQNPRGVAVYDRIRDRMGPDMPIVVTGHSLGGAIAIQVSLLRPGVSAFAFNGSPRFRAGPQVIDNDRVSIVEYGEILKLARIFGRAPSQDYYSIGCTRGPNPIRQHGIRLLADCLTRAAAYDDRRAYESMRRNAIPPP